MLYVLETVKPCFLQVWDAINESRRKRIQEYCDQDVSRRNRNFRNGHYFLYNDRYKIIYCYVPKVACTQWKKVFLTLKGIKSIETLTHHETHTGFRAEMERMKNLPYDQIQLRLRDYKKILFVREPFERLLSAYRDKFEKENTWFKQAYGRRIVKNYRFNATQEEIKAGKITFPEFLQYVGDRHFDEHWEVQFNLCQPCTVDFDFIGDLETLQEDAKWIFNKTGLSKELNFPPVQGSKTMSNIEKYYSMISKETLRKLVDIYKTDSECFGYQIPESIQTVLN